MRKTIAAAAASLVALTACAPMRTLVVGQPFDSKHPKVFIVASKNDPTRKFVVVDQEPIYFFKDDGRQIPIRWELQTSGYKFDPTNGISSLKTLSGASGQVHSCKAEAGNERAFLCINENSASGLYKYTIHVVATDGSGDPRPVDPTVGND